MRPYGFGMGYIIHAESIYSIVFIRSVIFLELAGANNYSPLLAVSGY
jgi:hypothetical protein